MKLIGHVLTNRDGAAVAMIISQHHVLLLLLLLLLPLPFMVPI